jgi:hypothetical protein
MMAASASHAQTTHQAQTDATDEQETTAAKVADVSDAALVKSLRGFRNGYAEVNGVRLHDVVGGKGDIMGPTIDSYTLFQQLPGARLLLYPDAGHGALFQYADEFVRTGLQVLDG